MVDHAIDVHHRSRMTTTSITPPPSTLPLPSPRVDLMGLAFDNLSQREVVARVCAAMDRGEGGWIVTPNLDQLRAFRQDPEIRSTFERADLVVADGTPLVWASRLQGTPLPERVAGSDLIYLMTEAAAARGARVFLLGGNPGAGEAAAAKFAERFPGVDICGIHCPPFGFEQDEAAWEAMVQALDDAAPDLVWVALGFPRQDRVIGRLRDRYPDAWFAGIGISLSFVSGEVRRAPRWLQRLGLEWVHRLAQEPRRLFKRYFMQDLPFAPQLFASALYRRLRAGRQA
jgi:N-acetylglucosaminyldiphosphoundecaprenol N-acetyl-beta-D-mannosaminyltransferase